MNRSQNDGILSEKLLNALTATESGPSVIYTNNSGSKITGDSDKCASTALQDRRMSLSKAYSCSDTKSICSADWGLFISPRQLVDQLSQSTTMIIDCRSQFDYCSERIRSSYNINCRSKLIARKLISKRLEQVEPSLSRSLNCSDSVVLYDQSIDQSSEEQIRSLPIYLVVQSARRSNKKVHIIQGGFMAMKSQYSSFIECSVDNCRDEDEKIPEISTPEPIDKENFIMTEILPQIFVGNVYDAQNSERLKQFAITHIVNATPDLPFPEGNKIHSFRVAILDSPSENILQHFESTINFIDDALLSKSHKVLVHCSAGISRSPTLVLAYMIKHHHLSFEDALKQMRQLRSIIDPNFSFISQLRNWEKKCRMNSEIVDENRSINATSSVHFQNSRSRSSSQYCGSTSASKNESKQRSDAPIVVT